MLLKIKKNKKGFTLIELIVVVAILAILAAIAVPSFIGLQDRAQEGVDIGNATAIAGAINTYNAMQTVDTNRIIAQADKGQAILSAATVNMWPSGIAAADLGDATKRVNISPTGVATVNITNPFH